MLDFNLFPGAAHKTQKKRFDTIQATLEQGKIIIAKLIFTCKIRLRAYFELGPSGFL